MTTTIAPPQQLVAVDRIHVPETRRRQKLGSLAGLEKSIKEHGLLHALIVDDDLTLIAGARRLEAVKRLGFVEVEVRRWGQLTEEERDAIEVQENVCREDLDAYERSAQRWREMRAAAEAVEVESSAHNGARKGRPVEPLSERSIAAATGQAATSVRKTRQHVELGDRFPLFRQKSWNRSKVLDCWTSLRGIPKKQREAVLDYLSSIPIPVRHAMDACSNFAGMEPAARAELVELAQGTLTEKSRAGTRLLKVPPPVQAACGVLSELIRKAERLLDDEQTTGRGDLQDGIRSFKSSLEKNKESYQALKRREGF